jgi:hypothetical protein
MRYAVRKKRREKKGVERRWMATRNWSVTTARVRYFVRGSWPQSFVTFFQYTLRRDLGWWHLWMGFLY